MASSNADVLAQLGFERLHDLGFYRWMPEKFVNNDNKSPTIAGATLSELAAATDLAPIVPALSDLDVLNQKLRLDLRSDLAPQKRPKHFPYIVPRSLALWVAKMRLEDVGDAEDRSFDFVFGGSTLDMLLERAIDNVTWLPGGIQQKNDTRYRVQKINGAIMVSKVCNYDKNYADPGFQFERFLTGGKFADREPDFSSLEHLQLMSVCGCRFKVLFTADVDAAIHGSGSAPSRRMEADAETEIVEIKSGNPRNFGKKLVLQMLSSGAKHLVYARKTNRSRVDEAVKVNLDGVFTRLIGSAERAKLVRGCTEEANLAETLAELRQLCEKIPDCMDVDEAAAGETGTVSFDLVFDAHNRMQLVPTGEYRDSSTSPKEVLHQMLK
eukprot:g15921.t1